MLGSIVRSTSVALVRPEKLDRLTDPSKPNLAVGSRTGDDSWNPMFLWGAEYLKWNVRWILGYGGGGEMRLAFQRGESDLYAIGNLTGASRVRCRRVSSLCPARPARRLRNFSTQAGISESADI